MFLKYHTTLLTISHPQDDPGKAYFCQLDFRYKAPDYELFSHAARPIYNQTTAAIRTIDRKQKRYIYLTKEAVAYVNLNYGQNQAKHSKKHEDISELDKKKFKTDHLLFDNIVNMEYDHKTGKIYALTTFKQSAYHIVEIDLIAQTIAALARVYDPSINIHTTTAIDHHRREFIFSMVKEGDFHFVIFNVDNKQTQYIKSSVHFSDRWCYDPMTRTVYGAFRLPKPGGKFPDYYLLKSRLADGEILDKMILEDTQDQVIIDTAIDTKNGLIALSLRTNQEQGREELKVFNFNTGNLYYTLKTPLLYRGITSGTEFIEPMAER